MDRHCVLVAGAGGFIGGHLVAHLLETGQQPVRAVDIKPLHDWYQLFPQAENVVADLQLRELCQSACAGAVEVYNLAAHTGSAASVEKNKTNSMLSVFINTHLLSAARDAGSERFFLASSASVYPGAKERTARIGFREEDAYPALPADGHGCEKLFSERMCGRFQQELGLTTRVARLYSVYGPRAAWEGGLESAPAAICRKVIHAKSTGQHEIEIWGDGSQLHSFTYIDDCVAGIDRIMHSEIRQPINLGTSELVTIDDLVSMVEELADVRLQRRYQAEMPRRVEARSSDNTRIQEYLDWQPSISLRNGIAETFDWVKTRYEARYANSIVLT